MTFQSIRTGLLLFCLALLTTTIGDTRLSGQTAPHPGYAAVVPMRSITLNPVPADLNNDGRMDLVAGRRFQLENSPLSGGELVALLGNGDGTFGSEQLITTPTPMAAPVVLADFNHDGNTDLVAIDMRPLDPSVPREIWILAGHGDGTFGAPVVVGSYPGLQFNDIPPNTGLAADLDGDAHVDLAIALEPNRLEMHPGRGDLTFGQVSTVTTSARPQGATVADLNADNRSDIVVAARDGKAVDVFLNRGGFVFGAFSTALDRAAQDVTAADLNADGKVDLLVAAATEDIDFPFTFHDGSVLVMLGNGDGTFQAPSGYATPRGTVAIVTGDFNRDGLIDVATANSTVGDEEECGPLWDSVSILAGNGAGALGSAASYQLSYDPADEQFINRMRTLHAAPLDGDAHLDMVTGGGILLNRPPSPNRTPIANAGPDQTMDGSGTPGFEASASDPDNDLLFYEWRDETDRVIGRCLQPDIYFPPGPGEERSYTLIVRDGRGGTATDTVTLTNNTTHNAPSLQLYRPQFGNPVPAYDPYLIQWTVTDPDGGTIVDLDISVDRNGQNNFTPIPACTNLSGEVSECVWSDPGPPSSDASLLFRITDSQGDVTSTIARFQIVAAPAGPLPSGWSSADVGDIAAAGAAGFDGRVFTVRGSGGDIWSAADEFHWAYTAVSGDFEVSARVALVQNVNPWTKAGLMIRETQAAGSRHAFVLATPGTTKPVSFQRRPATDGPSVHTAGAVDSPPVWLMLRRTGDTIAAFYRADRTGEWIALGTQELTALPASVLVGLPVSSHVDGTTATASFDNVAISLAGAPGLQVLRPAAGEQVQVNGYYTVRWMPAGDASGIARYDVFFAQDSGGPWSPIDDCANVPGDARSCVWERPNPTGPGYIKVVATSRTGAQGEAQSQRFDIVVAASGTGGTPPGWTCGDIGAVSATGSCGYEFEGELSPDFVISGSGADIWGTADELSFARYAAYGDFSLTARVLFIDNVNRWTKAGIMIRDWDGQSPAPAGARHASLFVTPSIEKGTAFQRRPTDGGTSVHTAGPATSVPIWLKLIRTGDTIRAYVRKEQVDGWAPIGEQVFDGLPYELSAMLVVSSHVDGTIARASFDNVLIEDVQPLQSVDIGQAAAGTTSSSGPEITLEGNGADIWGTADAFRFHYTPVRGNASILVRVRSLEAVHAWSKAGVMFRETLDPGSKHVMAIVSPSRGLAMQSRSQTDGLSASTGPLPGAAPVWLYLRRYGDDFTASWSTDGEQWHHLGQTTLVMNREVLVGLPVTSHSAGVLATAVFDDLVIER